MVPLFFFHHFLNFTNESCYSLFGEVFFDQLFPYFFDVVTCDPLLWVVVLGGKVLYIASGSARGAEKPSTLDPFLFFVNGAGAS